MLTSTFRLCREAGACPEGYRKFARRMGGIDKYGADTPFSVQEVLDSNGLSDALWVLDKAVPASQRAAADRILYTFSADCAEHVLHLFEERYPGEDRPRKAIQAKRDWINGQISDAELAAARAAARAAAWAAEAARAAENDWQTGRLRELMEARP